MKPFRHGILIDDYGIQSIIKTGKNLVVDCKSHIAANNLVYRMFNNVDIFIQANKAEVVDLVRVDSEFAPKVF